MVQGSRHRVAFWSRVTHCASERLPPQDACERAALCLAWEHVADCEQLQRTVSLVDGTAYLAKVEGPDGHVRTLTCTAVSEADAKEQAAEHFLRQYITCHPKQAQVGLCTPPPPPPTGQPASGGLLFSAMPVMHGVFIRH